MTIADTPARLAAIVHEDGGSREADALLAAFARSLAREGWRVGGVVHERRTDARGRKGMYLVDLAGGREFCISQDLGPLSRACCVDPAGVAQAAGVLRQALAERPALAIVNRFGELEAGGGGFVAELAALVGANVLVLTAVARKHLAAWRRFTGGEGVELPAQALALGSWFSAAARRGEGA
ncbi:DUF2478 domain-containing protein [Pulveribacter suum]|uniref:Molybdenum ABC transporter ATP-binding protein n=1 Tax=Pulveribacter suum TaxID=2116657 RepID=A0A2P1NKG9_9BURK|nr:DUF2478 domain-containing protein [Pulveribacter suum]AVP57568.1 hypothetical protein C7H73_07780 [Pulveribacter suum]